ncbi:UNVERIFIED_CONTAM: hypothetical protein PYX00_011815 [Menopon gallinae]|uniref:RING-type domain-containing protein n=1 Tax=Menopon gallinae TaxID=328185 RepID=A0AAW2H8I4_9NEOP
MKDARAMKILIYCNSCYKNEESNSLKFYIGECMHLLCKNCIEDIDLCKICKKTCEFKILEHDLKESLTKEPSSFLINTVETSMFQLSSSINLALYYRSQISTYKSLLKKAREELERCKKVRDICRLPQEESRKMFFHKSEKKSDFISSNIDRIYRMGRDSKILAADGNKENRAPKNLVHISKKAGSVDVRPNDFNESGLGPFRVPSGAHKAKTALPLLALESHVLTCMQSVPRSTKREP